MSNRLWPLIVAIALGVEPATAQEADAPFFVPDWLSDSIIRPHSNIASSAAPPEITVMPIGAVQLDAVGLLPRSLTGLPADLWGASPTETLARLFRAIPPEGLPAMLDFTEMLALAELDPPADTTPEAELFLARLDMLLTRGALEQARALIERAGPTDPQVFRRFFDVSLLTERDERACAAMRANPDIAPAFPARIFCLARSGDWTAAALSLGTAEALGQITTEEGDLIARFLDPELFEGADPLPPDPQITPLFYVMRAAVGERPASVGLPLAFAHSDLAEVAGWRAQISAAERLVRAGAIEPQEWLAIATAHRPAASGGVWDRLAALQAFDVALLAADTRQVAATLPDAVVAMEEAGLITAFAALYSDPLMRLPLSGEAARLSHRVALLSPSYERAAQLSTPQNAEERFLFAIARGQSPENAGADPTAMAVAAAFSSLDMPDRYRWLIDENRTGEALLRASQVLMAGAQDSDDIRDALGLFRALGLEDVARRAALQLMLLGRGPA